MWSTSLEQPGTKHNFHRSQEDYIIQVSEEIEGKVTKKLSKDFSRTESRILGALSRFDEFLLNPLIQGHSGSAPATSRDTCGEDQGTNEDYSQSDPHPEARVSMCQYSIDWCPVDAYYRKHSLFVNILKKRLGYLRKEVEGKYCKREIDKNSELRLQNSMLLDLPPQWQLTMGACLYSSHAKGKIRMKILWGTCMESL